MTVLFEDIVVWTKYRLMWNLSFYASSGFDLTGRPVFTEMCDEILNMIRAQRCIRSDATYESFRLGFQTIARYPCKY
jgi:hypothetical protein